MKINLYLFFSLVTFGSVQAQTTSPFTINSMGGTGTLNGNIYDWSFGEMTLVNTSFTANLIVTQGVLQPSVDSIAAGIHSPVTQPQPVKVYPNPAQNIICFESDYKTASRLQYDVIDVSGKIVTSKKTNTGAGYNKQTITLTALPAGIYMLRITIFQEKETFIQTYKVQKIN